MSRYLPSLLIPLAALVLAGCNGASSDGQLDIALTDSPADQASSLVVEFKGVKFQPAGGTPLAFTFPKPQQIDLTQLQSGVTTPLLANLSLPAGRYQWLELEVSATTGARDSYLVDSTGKHGLVLTAAGLTGLRINQPFEVQAGDGRTLVVDFDARKSVLPPLGIATDFRLQPVLRMTDALAAGNVIGSVPGVLAATAGCTPVVYVYAGTVTTPHDIDATAPVTTQPLSESPVKLDTAFGPYRFTAAYLPAGTYTLAFTCDAGNDDPSKPDALSFNPTGTVQVAAGQTVLTQLH